MSDALGFLPDTKPDVADLSTPRGRLLYLRDVVVPGIDPEYLRMEEMICGTVACLGGWAAQDPILSQMQIGSCRGAYVDGKAFGPGWDTFFGLTDKQASHLFLIDGYQGCGSYNRVVRQPTHAELTQHINDVLEGRVK